MKKVAKLFFLISFLVVSFNPVHAQQEEKSSNYFNNGQSSIPKGIVNILNDDLYKEKAQQESTISTIYLSQIGDNNKISINSKSGSSQAVTQNGDDNFYSFKDKASDSKISFDIKQTGDGNHLRIYGTNSLINGYTFEQYSAPSYSNFRQGITINNYKF